MTNDTLTLCQNPDCRRDLFDDPSDEDERFCHDCGDLFPAWCPQEHPHGSRALDEWERIAWEDLVEGADLSGAQCGDCGAQAWVLHGSGQHWFVKCEEDLDHADDPDYPTPCGAEYGVEFMPGRKIVW